MMFFFQNSSFSIDTFFFLRYTNQSPKYYRIIINFYYSGITISTMFYASIDKMKIDKFCPALEQLLCFIILLLNKFLKLILPYTVVLILVQLVMKYLNAFSIIEIPSIDHLTCETNMWRNVLFIDTFYPIIERVSKLFNVGTLLPSIQQTKDSINQVLNYY